MQLNKAKKVREALGLTPTHCGQLLLGSKPKAAYDQWTQWENGTRNPSRATEKMFNIILSLKMAKDLKTPGSDKALDLIIKLLGDDQNAT